MLKAAIFSCTNPIYLCSSFIYLSRSSNHLVCLEDTSVSRNQKTAFQSFEMFSNRDMKASTHHKGIRGFFKKYFNTSVDIHCQIVYKKSPLAFCNYIGQENFIPNDYIPQNNMFSSCFSKGLSSFTIVI